MIKEWRQIPDFPGYEVSNLGEVRSTMKSTRNPEGNPYLLAGAKDRNGYTKVILTRKNASTGKPEHKNIMVHRLVAQAFVPNPEDLPFSLHIVAIRDGGTNAASNLRWGTAQDNSDDLSKDIVKRNSKRTKFTPSEVVEIRERYAYGESISNIALIFFCSEKAIKSIVNNKTWKNLD